MNQIFKKFILELFYPSFCFGCNKEGKYLCDDCWSLLEISEYHYCLCSKNPIRIVPKADDKKSEKPFGTTQGKCSRCSLKKLNGLYFALPYKERSLTRKLIHYFKYDPYIKDLAKTLAGLVLEHLILTKNNTEEIWENSLLIPIPLEKKKLKNRGFNQAEELAKELSSILQIPLIPNNLLKIRKKIGRAHV